MTGKDILTALGGTDEKYIEECFTQRKRGKAEIIRLCAAAACLAVTAAGVFAAVTALNNNAEMLDNLEESFGTGDVKENAANDSYGYSEEFDGDYSTVTDGAAALVPKWEERSITSKFSKISSGNGKYSACAAVAETGKIGAFIEKTVVTGRDEGYTEKEYTQNAELYELRGIAKEAALAVKYEGDENFYICQSYTYKAATLERLITDLGLEKNLKFTSVGAYIRKNDKVSREIKYSGWSANKITELLLACKAARSADESEVPWFSADVQINAEIEALGQAGAYIAISRDGYLETNILSTGKLFFIGKAAAERFTEYFENECEAETLRTYSFSYNSGDIGEACTSSAVTSPYIP